MILDRPLTADERGRSQHWLHAFNAINGLSYMCVGETIMILLAVRLGFPDSVVGILGGMIFFGFLLLPLGKTIAARVGGARSQAWFWTVRNLAALGVASTVLWHRADLPWIALVCMIGGAFLFYGFRAAGVVMAQPLIGDITLEAERPAFIAKNGAIFYAACFAALVAISLLFRLTESAFAIAGVITIGAALGITSSAFLRRIDETRAIQTAARRPIAAEMRNALGDRSLRRLLLSGFVNNLAITMLLPVTILFVKKGFGVSDTGALLLTLLQFATCALMSFAIGWVAGRVGPRRTLIGTYALLLLMNALWIGIPEALAPALPMLMLLFAMAGTFRIGVDNSMVHYFLQTVSPEQRVAASMILNMSIGVGAGIVGMILTATLLHLLGGHLTDAATGPELRDVYRTYFSITMIILAPGIFSHLRLEPLPIEKRRVKRAMPPF